MRYAIIVLAIAACGVDRPAASTTEQHAICLTCGGGGHWDAQTVQDSTLNYARSVVVVTNGNYTLSCTFEDSGSSWTCVLDTPFSTVNCLFFDDGTRACAHVDRG